MAGFRKRTRATQPFRRNVRSRRGGRFTRRRRTNFKKGSGNRTGAVITGYSAANADITFRQRKTSLRRFRKMLWDSTLYKPHYRSLGSTAFLITTPAAGQLSGTFQAIRALSSVNPFWTTAGGAQQIDDGVVVPIFNPASMIIRGGTIKTTISNRSNDESLRVRVWCVWGKDDVDSVALPASGTPFPVGWDPTMIPDFHQGFRIIFGKEVLLLPGHKPMEVSMKLKIQKLDINTFITEAGRQFYWMYHIAETDDSDATVSAAGIVNSHNLSFSSDATT